jgi:hypothetical protein
MKNKKLIASIVGVLLLLLGAIKTYVDDAVEAGPSAPIGAAGAPSAPDAGL